MPNTASSNKIKTPLLREPTTPPHPAPPVSYYLPQNTRGEIKRAPEVNTELGLLLLIRTELESNISNVVAVRTIET